MFVVDVCILLWTNNQPAGHEHPPRPDPLSANQMNKSLSIVIGISIEQLIYYTHSISISYSYTNLKYYSIGVSYKLGKVMNIHPALIPAFAGHGMRAAQLAPQQPPNNNT